MDRKPIDQGAKKKWLPWPGRHVVKLVNPQGEVHDEIRLEVRGAGLASPKIAIQQKP